MHFRDEALKERLFTHHPCVVHLAEVLFEVFVSIEMTGESVQFEQKLSYRQPMYKVIDYIWTIDNHRQAIVVWYTYTFRNSCMARIRGIYEVAV